MTLFRGSRYEGANSVPIKLAGSARLRTFVYYRKHIELADVDTDQIFEYRVVHGDTLQSLAARFADDDTKWHIIAEINELLDFPLVSLIAGTKLLMPSREAFELL